MSKKSVSRKLSDIKRVLPRLPHPSWVWAVSAGNTGRTQVSSAEEFWNRLGL